MTFIKDLYENRYEPDKLVILIEREYKNSLSVVALKTANNNARDEILQALARGYCAPINSGKELDSDLILAMADELAKLSPVA